MKRVFIVHGLGGKPNGGWRPWLMGELEKLGVYAFCLSMPTPDRPVREEWVAEISRYLERDKSEELYLVGHSLGVPSILRCLESLPGPRELAGAVLISGRVEPTDEEKLRGFFDKPFDFMKIKSIVRNFAVIHGDDDPVVPFRNAEILSKELDAELIAIQNGKHLNGSSGWHTLPQCLEALQRMMR